MSLFDNDMETSRRFQVRIKRFFLPQIATRRSTLPLSDLLFVGQFNLRVCHSRWASVVSIRVLSGHGRMDRFTANEQGEC